MTMTATAKYNVGGVELDRPFKIRRLGHTGFNVNNVDASVAFYRDLLGFSVSDRNASGGYFLRYGSDHHALVLLDKQAARQRAMSGPAASHYNEQNDINQITWQVQSLREMVEGTHYFRSLGHDIRTEGRAGGPGSNWHLYVYDPDNQINELYYGIEQIGWDGYSKPVDMRHGYDVAPDKPHPAERDEVSADFAKGIDVRTGYRYVDEAPATYDVDGILLPRPFKVVRLGPIRLFTVNVPRAVEYYRDIMGFEVTEEVSWHGETGVYLRSNTEHHSLALFPLSWRLTLGMNRMSTHATLGMQVANYRQLCDAITYLRERGVRVETTLVPQQLHPGITYAAHIFDPDNHCIELYCEMEQVGWDGRPRPAAERPKVDPLKWPAVLQPTSDTYRGETFMGPWA